MVLPNKVKHYAKNLNIKSTTDIIDAGIIARLGAERLLSLMATTSTNLSILAETQGFKLISNSKQLASYSGYDVIEKESGTSIKGKKRISKKGNSRVRAALHFPALVAARFNQPLKTVYTRINQNKTSKMVGATALQRKILVQMYSLWKNDTICQEKITSGNQETKPLLRHKDEVLVK